MSARQFRPRWRYSRNELSGEPGAFQLSRMGVPPMLATTWLTTRFVTLSLCHDFRRALD